MADKKRVGIKFQYYQLCTFDGSEYMESLYDLLEWMSRMEELTYEERVHEVNGIEGRIESMTALHGDMFYALNFMRLDVISNTYILEKDSEARHVDLQDDEYIGKNTVVLYDPKMSIAMVQCNRGSYGVHALESYINSFNEPDDLCYFRPIDNRLQLEELENMHALKLDIRFANIRQFRPKRSKFFERVIEAFNQVECYTAHVECGLGYARGKELEKDTIYNIASDLRNEENIGTVSSARLTLSDDQKSSIYDLFQNIYYDKIDFTVPPRKELTFREMSAKMVEKYYDGGSRRKIHSILSE